MLTMEDMDLGLKKPSTLHFTIMEKFLMVIVDVDICLITDPIIPLIQVSLVYCWIFLFLVMREVDIGLRPPTLLNITMV